MRCLLGGICEGGCREGGIVRTGVVRIWCSVQLP